MKRYPTLESLQLYGLEPIEDLVWAGLVTADPLLLIGGHGTAKTTLAERIAGALGEVFWAYDASKALFEDVIGFPDPSSLSKGECRYIPTKLSIWDKSFILVDEISRATPSMQNKWLEIIRSRRVMGMPMSNIRYIFAAMNPPSYQGAYPLDSALVGRFGFILRMPEVWEMGDREVASITTLITPSDAPGLASNSTLKEKDPTLCEFIAKGREIFFDVEKKYRPALVPLLTNLCRVLASDHDLALDGRRLGLIYRGLIALFAVKHLKGEAHIVKEMLKSPLTLYNKGLKHLLPYATTTDGVKEKMSEVYFVMAHSGRKVTPSSARQLDPLEVLVRLKEGEELSREEVESAADSLVKSLAVSLSPNAFIKRILVLEEFMQAVIDGRLSLDSNSMLRLLNLWQKVTAANQQTDEVFEVARSIFVDRDSTRLLPRCAIVAACEDMGSNLGNSEKREMYLNLCRKGEAHEVASL